MGPISIFILILLTAHFLLTLPCLLPISENKAAGYFAKLSETGQVQKTPAGDAPAQYVLNAAIHAADLPWEGIGSQSLSEGHRLTVLVSTSDMCFKYALGLCLGCW